MSLSAPAVSNAIRARLAARRLGFALLDASPLPLALAAAGLAVNGGWLFALHEAARAREPLALFVASLAMTAAILWPLFQGILSLERAAARSKAQSQSDDPWEGWLSLSRKAFRSERLILDLSAAGNAFAWIALAMSLPALAFPPAEGMRLSMAFAALSAALDLGLRAAASGEPLLAILSRESRLSARQLLVLRESSATRKARAADDPADLAAPAKAAGEGGPLMEAPAEPGSPASGQGPAGRP